ncbi:MAG: hypothetical protein ACRC7S_12435 [Cetobacterium sp.]
MLAVKEIQELTELIRCYQTDEKLIRFIHLAHLIDPKADDSVLRLKELIILGINVENTKKED